MKTEDCTLTMDDIRAAQYGDAFTDQAAAMRAVIDATDSRVIKLADTFARRIGYRVADYREEFSQVGRIAVWESLKRFDGPTVDSFMAFVYVTVETTLTDAMRKEKNGAADADATKIFASMLTYTDNDEYLAEKIAQTLPPKGRRLSADRAHAARLAWQGTVSMDAPIKGDDTSSFGSMSQAFSYGAFDTPDDLVTSADLTSEAGRQKRALVHGVLDSLSDRMAHVLRASYGIDPVPLYGCGRDDNNDDELAEDMGITVAQVRQARSRGYDAFEKRFAPLMGWNE